METRGRILGALLAYVNDNLGFRVSASNREKLEAKLSDLNLPRSWANLEAFYGDLVAGKTEARETLVKAITVNHTFFLRESAPLEALVAIARKRGSQGQVIWCAASSTGEEAYSLAILLLEAGIEDFKIVASDVSARVLHEMNRGLYTGQRLEGLSRYLLLKYFERVDEDHWRVLPELRRRMAVKRVNLTEPIRFEGRFDYILCRNVFIYFDEAARRRVLATLMENLAIGGYLVLGLTEGLLELPPGLERRGQSLYRRVSAG